MPHTAVDYKKYLSKMQERKKRKKSHGEFRWNHLHKLAALSFNLLPLHLIDWTLKWETCPPPGPPHSSTVVGQEKSFLLMKRERHRPRPLYLIKRDFSQTSLGGEEQPDRLMRCVTFLRRQQPMRCSYFVITCTGCCCSPHPGQALICV